MRCFSASLLLFFSTAAFADPREVSNQDYQNAMAYGSTLELNSLTAKDQDLFIRLHTVPIFESDCLIETHGICQNQHFISVSEFDVYPDTRLYKTGIVGEVIGINWLNSDSAEHATLQITYNVYTEHALQSSAEYGGQIMTTMLMIGLDNIVEK